MTAQRLSIERIDDIAVISGGGSLDAEFLTDLDDILHGCRG